MKRAGHVEHIREKRNVYRVLTLNLLMWRICGELLTVPANGRWDLTWHLKG